MSQQAQKGTQNAHTTPKTEEEKIPNLLTRDSSNPAIDRESVSAPEVLAARNQAQLNQHIQELTRILESAKPDEPLHKTIQLKIEQASIALRTISTPPPPRPLEERKERHSRVAESPPRNSEEAKVTAMR